MMNLAQAKMAGLKAFEFGRGRAPALNAEFIKAACDQKDTDLVDLLVGYSNGWDVANLANNAIPGAPSIQAYGDIMAQMDTSSLT